MEVPAMRYLRLLVCALVMLGVSGVDFGASLDSLSLTSQSAMARRHRKKRHHKKKHARKKRHSRRHARSHSAEL
jgi:hypothetical protein